MTVPALPGQAQGPSLLRLLTGLQFRRTRVSFHTILLFVIESNGDIYGNLLRTTLQIPNLRRLKRSSG